MLVIEASAELAVETDFILYRPLPETFGFDGEADFAMAWEWWVQETDVSDSVQLSMTPFCHGVWNHTRLTVGWPVLFDPPRSWRRHRVPMLRPRCPGGWEDWGVPPGVFVGLHNPSQQTVRLASLVVEMWPRGSLEPVPLLEPHRPPPLGTERGAVPFTELRGVAAGALEDLDHDGLPEILTLDRRGWARLYRNDGAGGFGEELTTDAGLEVETVGAGAMFLDLDGDRDRDLLVAGEFDEPRLFERERGLRFRERRVAPDRISFWYGATADDLDRDGDVDLLFTSPLSETFLLLRQSTPWRYHLERPVDPARLPRSEGHFSASFADVDEDGWPELFAGRELWFENRGGRLQIEPPPWEPVDRGQSEGGLWEDFDGDGRLDLLVARDTTETFPGRTRLLLHAGEGWIDGTERAGLPVAELVSLEATLAEDFDLDGDLDLYLCQRSRPNFLLLNDGRARFADATDGSGLVDAGGCDAALAGDVDGDGAVDVVILAYGERPRVLRNRLGAGRWLGVEVAGKRPNTQGLGSAVRVVDPGTGEEVARRWVRRGNGSVSVGPAELRLGLGDRTTVDVEVVFPTGERRRLPGVAADRTIQVRATGGTRLGTALARAAEARFQVRRWFQRGPGRDPRLPWVVAAVGLGLGWLGLRGGRARFAPLAATGLAVVALVFAGSRPGVGPEVSPALGAALGAVAGATAARAPRWWGAIRRRGRSRLMVGEEPGSVEELMRLSLDFRHSSVEERTLNSIEIRVKNLFREGELRPGLLRSLRPLVAGFEEGTGARLRELLRLFHRVFPEAEEGGHLDRALGDLGAILGELEGIGADDRRLAPWSARAATAVVGTRTALRRLLLRLDERCSCDVVAVVNELRSLHLERAADAPSPVRWQLPERGEVRGVLPRGAFAMILDNLLANALSAVEGRPDPRVEIAVVPHDSTVEIVVEDDGPGVDPRIADRLFGYGATSRGRGHGYGLARSREIAGHFGGSLTHEARPVGARFVLSVRRAGESGPEQARRRRSS